MRFSLPYYLGSIPDAELVANITLSPLVVSAVLTIEGGPIIASDSWSASPFDLSEENTSPFALNPIDMTPLDMEN